MECEKIKEDFDFENTFVYVALADNKWILDEINCNGMPMDSKYRNFIASDIGRALLFQKEHMFVDICGYENVASLICYSVSMIMYYALLHDDKRLVCSFFSKEEFQHLKFMWRVFNEPDEDEPEEDED